MVFSRTVVWWRWWTKQKNQGQPVRARSAGEAEHLAVELVALVDVEPVPGGREGHQLGVRDRRRDGLTVVVGHDLVVGRVEHPGGYRDAGQVGCQIGVTQREQAG